MRRRREKKKEDRKIERGGRGDDKRMSVKRELKVR